MADQTLGSEIDIKLEPGPGLSSRRIGSGRRRIHEEGKQQCLWLGTGPEAESVLRQFKEVERREGFKQHKTFLSHLLTTYSNRSNSHTLPLQPQREAAPCPQSPKPPMSVSKREECSQVLGDLVVTSNSSLDNRVWLSMKSTPSDFLRGQDSVLHPSSSNEMGHQIGAFPAPYHHPLGSDEDGPSDFAKQPHPLSHQPQAASTYSQPRPLSHQPQAAGTYRQPRPLSHQPQPTGTYSQPHPLSHQPQPTGTYSQLHPMLSCSPMAQHMPGPMQHPDLPHNISISQDFHGGLTPQDQLSQLVEEL